MLKTNEVVTCLVEAISFRWAEVRVQLWETQLEKIEWNGLSFVILDFGSFSEKNVKENEVVTCLIEAISLDGLC